jgi:hypothetical protein
MARTTQGMRDSKGRYVKITILNKVKYFCNFFMTKIDKWAKSVEK